MCFPQAQLNARPSKMNGMKAELSPKLGEESILSKLTDRRALATSTVRMPETRVYVFNCHDKSVDTRFHRSVLQSSNAHPNTPSPNISLLLSQHHQTESTPHEDDSERARGVHCIAWLQLVSWARPHWLAERRQFPSASKWQGCSWGDGGAATASKHDRQQGYTSMKRAICANAIK